MKYLKYSTVQLIDDVPERCKLRWVGEILRRASLLYDMMESYGKDDVEQSSQRTEATTNAERHHEQGL